MIVGKKYVNNAIFYTTFKKHYCPACETKLTRVKASKIVNSKSPEAKNYDFTSGDSFMVGDVEFIWKEFYCPTCKKRISMEEMKQIEKEQRERYNKLEYVQTWFTKYEDRFFPIDMSRAQEDIAEKSKINYQTDEYGFLPQYRIELLNTSKRMIPTNLIYIGNFANAARPLKEFIPHSKENIATVAWKQFDETFETKMIKRYCAHNLRELGIYHK